MNFHALVFMLLLNLAGSRVFANPAEDLITAMARADHEKAQSSYQYWVTKNNAHSQIIPLIPRVPDPYTKIIANQLIELAQKLPETVPQLAKVMKALIYDFSTHPLAIELGFNVLLGIEDADVIAIASAEMPRLSDPMIRYRITQSFLDSQQAGREKFFRRFLEDPDFSIARTCVQALLNMEAVTATDIQSFLESAAKADRVTEFDHYALATVLRTVVGWVLSKGKKVDQIAYRDVFRKVLQSDVRSVLKIVAIEMVSIALWREELDLQLLQTAAASENLLVRDTARTYLQKISKEPTSCQGQTFLP